MIKKSGIEGGECLEQISRHIAAHLGKGATVFHEIVSDIVHIDVIVVAPTAEFPFVRLVTSGMSDLPMLIPEGLDAPQFVEMFVTLPADWQLDQKSFENENWYWPIRLLKDVARYPHTFQTGLGCGHTIRNQDPPEPYAKNTRFCGSIILPSITVPDDFNTLYIDEKKTITFYAVVPLYAGEINLTLRSGADALLEKFIQRDITDIIDPSRADVTKKRFGFF